MKKLITITFLTLLCVTTFSQTDTTVIFHNADSLIKLADSFYDANKFGEAFELYNQSAEMTKDIEKGNNIHYATALYNIAWLYSDMGDYPNALKYHLQVMDIRKNVLGEDHPQYAKSLNCIGYAYFDARDNQNALKYQLLALDALKKSRGEKHIQYANTLTEIGNIYYKIGDYNNSLKYHLQALETYEVGHANYNKSLNNVGNVYRAMGDYQNALKYLLRAMEIKKKTLGEEHPDYATSLNNVGSAYFNMGDYQNALKYYLQALEIRRKTLGEEHPDYTTSLNNIGIVYDEFGDYQNALKYYLKALDIRKKVLGEQHPKYANSLINIGVTYSNMGDYQNALKYDMQALEIQKKVLGEEHPDYAAALNNIGSIYTSMGDNHNALKYDLQALNIWEKVLGKEHPDYAAALNNIGRVYNSLTDYQTSLKYHLQAIEIRKKVLGENHPLYATSLYNASSTYYGMGDFQNALKYSMQAIEIQKKVLGEEHPDYSFVLHNVGITYFKMGNITNAIKTNKKSTDINRNNLAKNFSYMTAHEREAYWDSNNEYFSYNIKYMYHSPNDTLATKTSYDTELITKGLLLASEMSLTNTIMESGDTALISEYETMKTAHLQLNKELERPIAERVYNCDSLENEIQKMERHIMEKSKEFGDVTHFIKIDWKEVQNSLKQNDVAIEFTNFIEDDTTRYLALVLTKDMEAPVCVPLFNQYDIAKLLRGIAPTKEDARKGDDNRGAISVTAKRQGIYESTNLYNVLWKPLEKYFPETPRIYFAPSGELHQIAVEYAPVDHARTISDKYEMYRMSSTRFLAMDYSPNPLKNSVLYGGIYYDSDTTTMKQESDRFTRGTEESYSSFAMINKDEARSSLPYLQGTRTEVEDIAAKMKKKKISITLYEGSQANEESFKALSGKNINVLHIATHGFFLPTDEKLFGDLSLVQSGLLLSGANYAWQNKPLPEGIEDGILTAKEISFMDLRKTDLVVLSACQTALGEISGEGVFGLQRGFKKAGTRTIIMSLWPVDDNATLLMMTEFYANLTKGMSKREAFLTAQNKVKNTPGFENPRFWAAFIMLDGNK